MPKPDPDEQYTPRGAKIPVPKREEFVRNLEKVTHGEPPKKKKSGANG